MAYLPFKPRGAGKARRGAPGARFTEVWTVPLHLPQADTPGFRFGFITAQ